MSHREAWVDKIRALARERSDLATRKFSGPPLTRQEELLVRHLERERELDYYQMKIMDPDFRRLELEVRSRKRLARKLEALGRKFTEEA